MGDDVSGYGGGHRPGGPDYGAPMDNVIGMFGNDFYERPNIYDFGEPGAREAIRLMLRARGNPETPVTMYRALPKDAPDAINPGDWVTIARDYAVQHGISNLDDDFKVIAAETRAGDLWTEGNSVCEWGFWGYGAPARTVHTSARTAGTVSEPGIIFRGFGVPFGEAQWEEIKEVEGTDRLASRVLTYLKDGFFADAGLGRHWTIDPEIAKNYSYSGRGWPVVVVADWDGRGEDRNPGWGGGQSVGQTWEHEQEVTLLPGTELRLIDIWWGPSMESIVPPGDRLVGLTIRAGREVRPSTPTRRGRVLIIR